MKASVAVLRGILVAVAVMAIGGWATQAIAQVDPRTTFELEGDISDTPAGGLDDWANDNCPAIDASSALVKTGAVPDASGTSIYTGGGSKDHIDISSWKYKNGSVPDKDDIVNAYAAQYAANGPSGATTILVVGGDRFANDGSAFIGAWFFQNEVALGPAGGGGGSPFTGLHKNGDILILAEFSQGGAVSTLKVFQWVGSAGPCPGGPCPAATEKGGTLADITPSPSGPVEAIGFSNSVPVSIPGSCSADWSYTPKSGTPGTFPPNSFFEVGIDLGALELGNVCFASFLVETRSSHDVDAVLKDFVLHSFAPCSIACGKTVAPAQICAGASSTYTYSAINDGGAALDIKALDDNATPGDTSDDFCVVFPATNGDACGKATPPCVAVTLNGGDTKSCTLSVTPAPGTYVNTLKVTGNPQGGNLALTCEKSQTLVVNPNPNVSINQLVCNASSASQGGSFTLTATPDGGSGGFSYLWTPGGETSSSITKTAVGTYSVSITDAKGCAASASRKVGFCSN